MDRSRAVRKKEDMILNEMQKVQMQLNNSHNKKKKKQLQQEYHELMVQLQKVGLTRRDNKRRRERSVTNVNKKIMYNKEANLRTISKQERQNYSEMPPEKSESSMRKATEQALRKLHNIDNREKELQKIDSELQQLEQKRKALIKEKENLEETIKRKKRKMMKF